MKNKLVAIIFVIVVAGVGGYFLYQYYSDINKQKNPVACTMEAKICPDGSSVGRVGPKCEFASCPDHTAGWNTLNNNEYSFSLKYPNEFFDAGHTPKILVGDCNYSVFPNKCPNIYNIVAGDFPFVSSAQNWDSSFDSTNKTSNFHPVTKPIINNIPYCMYSVSDAGMSQQYGYFYYVTVKNQKCLVVYMATSTTNCDFYLPLESGNTEQAKNYNDCLATNKNQPTILNEIINTFKFNK